MKKILIITCRFILGFRKTIKVVTPH